MAQTSEADHLRDHEFRLTPGTLSAEPLMVAVVGVGGTGSELTSRLINLHLGLIAKGFGGLHVVAFDPDTVAPANIVRQRYTQADIGRPKAIVLVNRINFAYSLGWDAVESRFDAEWAKRNWDVVISCVDTRSSRKELHRYAFRDKFSRWKFWLDCGNDKSTGQVVLGTPRCKRKKTLHMLPCATELHPELMDASIIEDNVPSCSAAESLNHQDLMVNSMAAILAVDMLWRLFRDGRLENHACYFDLESSSLSPRRVLPPKPRAKPKAKPKKATEPKAKSKKATKRKPRRAA